MSRFSVRSAIGYVLTTATLIPILPSLEPYSGSLQKYQSGQGRRGAGWRKVCVCVCVGVWRLGRQSVETTLCGVCVGGGGGGGCGWVCKFRLRLNPSFSLPSYTATTTPGKVCHICVFYRRNHKQAKVGLMRLRGLLRALTVVY